ncbi:MAG TPA: hypothetical protein VHK88_20455, partial [Aquihabitans sp.]|nr:hypothetical protein [Aquihabitans sp.]
LRARWEAVAGVWHFRGGDRRGGRRHLARAVRARPADPRHWGRLALSLVAPAADRRWARGRP